MLLLRAWHQDQTGAFGKQFLWEQRGPAHMEKFQEWETHPGSSQLTVQNAVLTISDAGTVRGWERKFPGMEGNRNILTHPSCQKPAFTWLALLESEACKRAAETGFELSHEQGHIYNYINSK